jgi:hypothetical protein
MNLSVVELMALADRDPAWLQQALQRAIELELSTLPPYLCGYWCLKDPSSYPAAQILKIIYQEMFHIGLACNMLSATGKRPEVLKGFQSIAYPGPLPGGVVPTCDGKLVPCDRNFQVMLGFDDFHAFAWMAAQIEYPEHPVPRQMVFGLEATFPTIGQFYDAILQAFQDSNDEIPYDLQNQRTGTLGLFAIDDVCKAIAAIQQIKQQGEGGDKNPFSGPNQLSHFYAFGELYNLHKYRFDPITEQGDFDGDPISLPYDQVYEMTPVPLRGYPAPPAEVIDFDHAFTRMLCHLDRAWAPGGAAELALATVEMPALTAKATQLLSKEIKRTDAPGIYGPQFKLI